jgi:hypothetical protein
MPPTNARAHGQTMGGDEESSNLAATGYAGRARQVELQQAIDTHRQQEQEPPTQEHLLQQPPPYCPQQQKQPSSSQGTINSKCPLANSLQLAPRLPQYRATPPLKYYGDSDPHKLLMCYEAVVALSGGGGDDTTLTK